MIALQYLPLFFIVICVQLALNPKGQETAATKYFLEKAKIEMKPYSLANARNGQLITSNLEIFRDLYASTKYFLIQQYERDYQNNLKYIVASGKVQKQIKPGVAFPCTLNNTRSSQTPRSVHKLRPGDIDIIAAMGDSLTAGTAMMSKNVLQILAEFRGQTFLGGGLKDWRSILTLPNILKVFNPKLYGYAVANTLGKFREARFNVAEPFAVMQDMPYMAEVLVKRMQSDPYVNMTSQWKMISVLIGANDICNEMCHHDNSEKFLESHRKDLHRTLTILRDNIPRVMVNVLIIPDLYNVLHAARKTPAQCDVIYKFGCHCLFGRSISSKQLDTRKKIIRRIQQIDMEVSSLPEFQLNDFAVVPRTFAVNKTFRLLKDGSMDLKYFAIDCFHFSQYGNAAFANMFWNDVLQLKTEDSATFRKPFQIFACPTSDQPFISTLQNS